jgi:hypothetical protein
MVALMFGVAAQATAEPLVAYSGSANSLLRFDSATPGVVSQAPITGMQFAEFIQGGIDFRPANGLLYGLTNQSRLYTINLLTGAATFVSTLSTPLSSPSDFFGLDFDPVADRLRVVSSTGQNLRINADTGETIVAGRITPANRNITASAYTNNFAGATETTLYGIDVSRGGFLVLQEPNSGVLTDVAPLSATFPFFNGFDISGQSGIAYATSGSRLFTINLATGQATLVGQIGNGFFTIGGLAAPVGSTAAVPEPTTMLLLGTGLAGIAARVRRRRKANQE